MSKQTVKYSGKIIQVIEEEKVIPNSNKTKVFEIAKRSPGVRALIIKDGKMLLSKEYRYELGDYDYRLPGGKVFDKLNDYLACNDSYLEDKAAKAVIKECYEEVGLKVKNPKLIHVSTAGATIIWNLYYYEITEFEEDKQHLEEGEIINFSWFDFEKVKLMCLDGKIKEDRSLGVILKYLLTLNSPSKE